MNLKKLMKQMKTEELEVEEVIFKMGDRKFIFKNPMVIKTEVLGKTAFQILGDYTEEINIREEDIELVMEKTGKSYEECKQMLKECKGDIAEAILRLSKV